MDFADFCSQYEGGDFGVTGTRTGCTRPQYEALTFAIENLHEHGGHRLHHGAAVGVDSEAHWRAWRLRASGMVVTLHPPIKKRYAALIDTKGKMDGSGLALWPGCEVLSDKHYGARDYDIVLASNVLLACPQYPRDDPRSKHSGTWLTVSFAWREHVPVFLVVPGGEIVECEREAAEA